MARASNFVTDGQNDVKVICQQLGGTAVLHSDSAGKYQGYWMDKSAERDLQVGFSSLAEYIRINYYFGLTVTSISLNDMTLKNGGKFDYQGTWNLHYPALITPYTNPYDVIGTASTKSPLGDQVHRYHRLGKSVDINFVRTNGVIRNRYVSQEDLDTYLQRSSWWRVLETGSVHYDYVVGPSSQSSAFLPVFPDESAATNATTGGAKP